ncbi:hypothetical protein L484_010307 [Morus notabilis]|uniref:Uncharacterized protein n=1 Tax=Morus notabilis TaxID=981085 RepID=W9QNL5_9ROSA|nr:hypothetical protein L484_010307 [Morus notabilis]
MGRGSIGLLTARTVGIRRGKKIVLVGDDGVKLKITLGELAKPLGYLNKDRLLFILIDCERLLSYDIKT